MKIFFLSGLKTLKATIIIIVAMHVIDSSIDPTNNFLGAYNATDKIEQTSYFSFIIDNLFQKIDVSDTSDTADKSKIKGPTTYYCAFSSRIVTINHEPCLHSRKFTREQLKFTPPFLSITAPPPRTSVSITC